MGRRTDPRRTYVCATPPCLDSQYETVDNIIRIWHIHRTAIPLLLKITIKFIVTK